ncbi:MAG: hypothetical protein CVU54_02690 [Deltaproteobacteria bacterium HGW-Deltaproteobacteria-12]|jgi:hypothetical protein|nr:MAG: hypothetical protein CVU54_02690 [Deltaproteobacteria bacterium HGW-Deltaproteobacteria-12]
MAKQPDSEIIPEDEVALYDYWKVIVKRKKILLGIIFVPVIMAIIIASFLPRYYQGEGEISQLVITAPNIVAHIGDIDEAKKNKIFTSYSDAVKNVLIFLSPKSTDKVRVIIDAKTADVIPRASNDLLVYISNLPEIRKEVDKTNVETDKKTQMLIAEADFRMQKLKEAQKANLVFLKQVTNRMKKQEIVLADINPADIIQKDADLSLEISKLEQTKTDLLKKKELKINAGISGPYSISKQPSDLRIKQILIIICVLSLFVGVVVIFFLEYFDRMKARDNK